MAGANLRSAISFLVISGKAGRPRDKGKASSGKIPQSICWRSAAKAAAAAHVEMEMVVMRGVVIGAEHGAEPLAGAGVDDLQKLPDPPVAIPVVLDADAPPVAQHAGGHVDRIAVRMFGQFAAAREDRKSTRLNSSH